jgi:hypothetical protein
MTRVFSLDFHGTGFTVPKQSLFDATSYAVQSSVPLEIFEIFVEALKTGTKVAVTKENAAEVSLLAKEFWLEDLLSECSALQTASVPELIASLSERISKLEHQGSSESLSIIAELKDSIADHERQLESLDSRIAGLELNLRAELRAWKVRFPAPLTAPTVVPTSSRSKSLKGAEFPLKEAKSVEGIICYLTRKHGGNVHDRGVITITSKSVHSGALRNVADLTSDSCFGSRNMPGQWICWDFQDMRVNPTYYTIKTKWLKSWVVESSLDGEAWIEIDRKTDNEDFKRGGTASYAVSNSAQCRFIRLTQTGKNHAGGVVCDDLAIVAFEFFGILFESRE